MESFPAFVVWMFDGIWSFVWSLVANLESYGVWFNALIVLGPFTALLASPFFFAARRCGFWRAMRGVIWLPATGLLVLIVLGLMPLSPGAGYALGFGLIVLVGFTTLLWLPISIVLALLGARARHAGKRPAEETPT